MKEEVEKWIKKAERDLFASEINLNEGLYEVSVFLSHQAVEKALKSLYILKFKKLWKINDLVGLGVKLNIPKNYLKYCDELTKHYIETKYPIDVDYDEGTAKNILSKAKEVVEWAKKTIKK